MKKFVINYVSSFDDDCCSVWVHANSKEEARENVCREYHDIKRIINIYERT